MTALRVFIEHVPSETTGAEYALFGALIGGVVVGVLGLVGQRYQSKAENRRLERQLRQVRTEGELDRSAQSSRLRTQLAQERTQDQLRLDAEATRLGVQLAHDRELKELEALRLVLDEGAEALSRARLATVRLTRFWANQVATDDPRHADATAAQRESIAQVRGVRQRLVLRLRPHDDIVERYEAAGLVLDAFATIFKRAEPTNYVQFQNKVQGLGDELTKCTDEFLEVSRLRVGPRELG